LGRDVLERLPHESAADLYSLARVRAQSAAQVGADEPSDDEKAERRRDADLAIEAPRAAITAGYKNVAFLKADEEFASLRPRPDFQELVAQLDATVKAEATAKAAEEAEARRRTADFEAAVRADTLAKIAHGTAKEQLQAQQEALAIRETLVQSDPKNRAHQADLAASQYAVGLILLDQGRTDEAAKTLAQALALREALVQADPKNATLRADLGSTHLALGTIDWDAGRLANAVRSVRRGLELKEEALRQEPRNPTILAPLATDHLTVAGLYWLVGLFRDAADHLDRSLQLEPPKSPAWWYSLGLARLYLGDVAGYRDLCRQMQQRFGSDSPYVVRTCLLAPRTRSPSLPRSSAGRRKPPMPKKRRPCARRSPRTWPSRSITRAGSTRPAARPAPSMRPSRGTGSTWRCTNRPLGREIRPAPGSRSLTPPMTGTGCAPWRGRSSISPKATSASTRSNWSGA
jgi:tetratricopeptide (TPR) repeat protein